MILLWNYKDESLPGKEYDESVVTGYSRRMRGGTTAKGQWKPSERKVPLQFEKYNETEFDISVGPGSSAVFYESPYALGYGEIKSSDLMLRGKDQLYSDVYFPGEYMDYDSTGLSIGKRTIVNPLWQYNEYADPRTVGKPGAGYGRVYHSKIRANNPVVYIQPGKPRYMKDGGAFGFLGNGRNNPQEQALREAIMSGLQKNDSGLSAVGATFGLDALVNELARKSDGSNGNPMKYYDFQPNFYDYRMYVKGILEDLMVRMGLKNIYDESKAFGINTNGVIDSSTDIITQFFHKMPWYKEALQNDTTVGSDYRQYAFIPFRIEKSSDASESFSTTTGSSVLESLIKGITDSVKEANFLMNNDGNKDISLKDVANAIVGGVGDAFNIGQNAATVFSTGSNMLFPEIWKESTYSKNYSLTIKLHAPYGDRRTYFENVLFPYAMIIALVLPRQSGSSLYVSPPLVRMYSKGWFSCDMGIVESVSIKRGNDKNDWTVDRLPRTVEITVSVKDLFSTMVLSLGSVTGRGAASSRYGYGIFMQRNTALRQYLNIIGGLDSFSESTIDNKFKRFWETITYRWQRLTDPRNIMADVQTMPIIQPFAKIRYGMDGLNRINTSSFFRDTSENP